MSLRQKAPDECTFCGSDDITKNRDEDVQCNACGYVVLHSNDDEVRYIQ